MCKRDPSPFAHSRVTRVAGQRRTIRVVGRSDRTGARLTGPSRLQSPSGCRALKTPGHSGCGVTRAAGSLGLRRHSGCGVTRVARPLRTLGHSGHGDTRIARPLRHLGARTAGPLGYSALLRAPTMSILSRLRLVKRLIMSVNTSDITDANTYVCGSTIVSKNSDGMRST